MKCVQWPQGLTVGHSCTLFPLHTNSDHVPILQDKYREYQSHATQDYERGSKMDRLRLHSDIPMVLDSTCITLRRPPPLRMKFVTPMRCNVFTRSIHESEQPYPNAPFKGQKTWAKTWPELFKLVQDECVFFAPPSRRQISLTLSFPCLRRFSTLSPHSPSTKRQPTMVITH